jgi:hypothetical protein
VFQPRHYRWNWSGLRRSSRMHFALGGHRLLEVLTEPRLDRVQRVGHRGGEEPGVEKIKRAPAPETGNGRVGCRFLQIAEFTATFGPGLLRKRNE